MGEASVLSTLVLVASHAAMDGAFHYLASRAAREVILPPDDGNKNRG
ncbi:MAG: hypothetical protein ACYDH3_10935 [Candidatus Aminicenantales bacterium]